MHLASWRIVPPEGGGAMSFAARVQVVLCVVQLGESVLPRSLPGALPVWGGMHARKTEILQILWWNPVDSTTMRWVICIPRLSCLEHVCCSEIWHCKFHTLVKAQKVADVARLHIHVFSRNKVAACTGKVPSRSPGSAVSELSPECDGYSAAVSCCRAGQVSARLEYVG